MVIDVYNTSDKNREKVIAVVGSCLGKLQVDHSWSHRWDVIVPTKDLTKSDYECLLRRGSDLKELVPNDEAVVSSTGMIVQKPDIYITDQR